MESEHLFRVQNLCLLGPKIKVETESLTTQSPFNETKSLWSGGAHVWPSPVSTGSGLTPCFRRVECRPAPSTKVEIRFGGDRVSIIFSKRSSRVPVSVGGLVNVQLRSSWKTTNSRFLKGMRRGWRERPGVWGRRIGQRGSTWRVKSLEVPINKEGPLEESRTSLPKPE